MAVANPRIILPAFVISMVLSGGVCAAAVPASGAEAALTSNPRSEGGAPPQAFTHREVQYKADGLKDPFKGIEQKPVNSQNAAAGAQQSKPLPPLVVSGIIWGGAFPQAIVNRKVVKIGDMVEAEVKVVDITKEGVVVFFDYKNYNLPPPAIDTKSQGSGPAK
ncbi:MAG: hypothetical protein WBE75_02040 [Candidatus Omnitrophota bacterium]